MIMTIIIKIQFVIYLFSYSAAERPIIIQARAKKRKNKQKTKQGNLYYIGDMINKVSASVMAPTIMWSEGMHTVVCMHMFM
jgi:hypothetical protein